MSFLINNIKIIPITYYVNLRIVKEIKEIFNVYLKVNTERESVNCADLKYSKIL